MTAAGRRPAGAAAPRWPVAAGLAAAAALAWLFVFNSGYGYDALEYLVIGRSLNDGQPFYSFVPSKSWAIYAAVAAWLRVPGAASHAGLATIVTGLLAASAAFAWRVCRPRFGAPAAAAAAAGVTAAGLFMELNYLQPEPFVFVSGLLAFAALANAAGPRPARCALAGAAIGAGMAFKSVAGCYAIGAAVWLAWQPVAAGGFAVRAGRLAALGAGLAVAVALPAAYFALTGRLGPHLEWQYVFPLLHYPDNPAWSSKLYTKLLWVWLAAGAGLAVWLRRGAGSRTPAEGLLAALGVAGLVPLLRTQASHYAFPGAAMLLVLAAVVWARPAAGARTVMPRRRVVAAVAVACAASAVAYRPAAALRLARVNSFAWERDLGEALRAEVGPGEHAIFVEHGAWLYWIGERYPPWPVVTSDVQTTHLVRRDAERLLRALDDPRVRLVEFDPDTPRLPDPALARSREGEAFLRGLAARLERDFERRHDIVPWLALWVRRSGAGAAATDD